MDYSRLKVLRPRSTDAPKGIAGWMWGLRNEAFTLWVLTSLVVAAGSFAFAKYNKCLETQNVDNLRVRHIVAELRLRSVAVIRSHAAYSGDDAKWIAEIKSTFDPAQNFVMLRFKGRFVADLALEAKIVLEDWEVWAPGLDVQPAGSGKSDPAIALHSFIFTLIDIQDILFDGEEKNRSKTMTDLREKLDRLSQELLSLSHPGAGYIPTICLRRTFRP